MKIIKIGGAAIVFIAVLELASRFAFFGFSCFDYRKMNSENPMLYSDLVRPSRHPGVLYELKPGLDAYYARARFVTNSAGIRDRRELPVAKPSRTFRIVVVGASDAMGHGIEQEDVFTSVLERRLNREASGVRYECINFARENFAHAHCWHLLESEGMRYRPDLVLFCVPTRGGKAGHEAEDRKAMKRMKKSRYSFFSCYFIELVKLSRLARAPRAGTDDAGYVPEQLAQFDDAYARLSRLRAASRVPVCVAVLRFRRDDPSDKCIEQIRERVAKHGLPFIDTTPAFAHARRNDEFTVTRYDPHPNEKAHGIFAEVVHRYLAEHGLLGSAAAYQEAVAGGTPR